MVLFLGTLALTFGLTRFAVWSDCDARYEQFMQRLELDTDLKQYFESKGQHDLSYRVLAFRPSGKRYSGSHESALPIVGGMALLVLGAFGALDTFRHRKETAQ